MITSFSLPLLEWINISAGKITLEQRHGEFEIAPFAIAKYPVTNAQFQAFLVAQDGYYSDDWWEFSRAAKAWHTANLEPASPNFIGNNLPRQVCWYEAIAFCAWLASKTGLPVMLPTEMQWQWAAQGSEGRKYPYGTTFDLKKCNTYESKIGMATPVDQYPEGQSPFGVFDMAGNFFEWCLNKYDNLKDSDPSGNARRTVRGGSWAYPQNFARAGCRLPLTPDDATPITGFRVALSVPV